MKKEISWLKRKCNAFYAWLPYHLPRRLITSCLFRVWGEATGGRWNKEPKPLFHEITMGEALERWDEMTTQGSNP